MYIYIQLYTLYYVITLILLLQLLNGFGYIVIIILPTQMKTIFNKYIYIICIIITSWFSVDALLEHLYTISRVQNVYRIVFFF